MAPLPPPPLSGDDGGGDNDNIFATLFARKPLFTTSLPAILREHGNSNSNNLSPALVPRLATGVDTVPEGYGRAPSGPAPGAVVGIVLGSVAGFLLLLCLIYWCVNLGSPMAGLETGSVSGVTSRSGGGRYAGSSSVVSRHSRPRVHRDERRSSKRHSASRAYTDGTRSRSPPPVPVAAPRRHRGVREVLEIRRGHDRRRRSSPQQHPPRASPEMDQIIVEEEHSDVSLHMRPPPSRGPPAPPAPPMPPMPPLGRGGSGGGGRGGRPASRHDVVTSDEDDEIVVLEEHSTPPRQRDRRSSRSHNNNNNTNSRRSSGSYYRDADLHRYGGGGGGGGDGPMRSTSRRGSSSRRYS